MSSLNNIEKGLRKTMLAIDFERDGSIYNDIYTGIFGDYRVSVVDRESGAYCITVTKGSKNVLEMPGSFAKEMFALVRNKAIDRKLQLKSDRLLEFLKVLEKV